MRFQLNDEFLNNAYFLCSPLLGKVWVTFKNLKNFQKSDLTTDKNLFYRNNFTCSLSRPWVIGEHFMEIEISDFFEEISKLSIKKPFIEWQTDNPNLYQKFFSKSIEGIKNFNIHKLVPFYQTIGKTKLDSSHLLYFLNQFSKLKENKSLFFYGYWNFNNQELQLGASPELLFIKKSQNLETIALAGTALDKKDFTSKKMKHEHNYVVNDLETELQQYGLVKKHRSQIVQFKQYFHKKTKFSVDCTKSNSTFESILKSVFPSPAIGAYPRNNGLSFLNQIEHELNIQRGFFASPFGIQINPNFMLCLAAIRGIEWHKDQFTITAGGGVVKESILESEWKEIGIKTISIKSIFGLI